MVTLFIPKAMPDLIKGDNQHSGWPHLMIEINDLIIYRRADHSDFACRKDSADVFACLLTFAGPKMAVGYKPDAVGSWQ
jgi:hypothetical protein